MKTETRMIQIDADVVFAFATISDEGKVTDLNIEVKHFQNHSHEHLARIEEMLTTK